MRMCDFLCLTSRAVERSSSGISNITASAEHHKTYLRRISTRASALESRTHHIFRESISHVSHDEDHSFKSKDSRSL